MFGLVIYFGIHLAVSGHALTEFPLYMFLLSLPGNLIIGGLEESGWMYILQPMLDKKYGYLLSSVFTGIIWIFWHIPLFFIPGTNHGDGLINFGMFAVQCLAFRFFFGAVYKVSGKSRIFMCVLFHTMFNAASAVFGTITMNWTGTITANTAIIFASIVTVLMYYKRHECTHLYSFHNLCTTQIVKIRLLDVPPNPRMNASWRGNCAPVGCWSSGIYTALNSARLVLLPCKEL